jgi:hypothetical protein
MHVNPQELLAPAITEDYIPGGGVTFPLFLYARNRPIFNFMMVREMLQDPRVIYGLRLIKGPILSSTQFDIQVGGGSDLEGFLFQQITQFWRFSAVKALKAIEWGYSGHEALYREDGPYIHFDMLKDLDPPDCKAVSRRGEIIGMKIKNIKGRNDWNSHQHKLPSTGGGLGTNDPYLGIPKAFWHIHDRERHPIYGLSRLYGPHIPWWETWSDGGYRDVRRLWFHKNAFEGGTMYHPPGVTRLSNGSVVSNKDLARELIEKKRTGGVLTLPNTTIGPNGDARAWEYIPPEGNQVPTGLLDYGELLRAETLEGLGVPPEVVESQSSEGFGSSSGREIPQMAFFSMLQEIVNWLVYDFNVQILRHLVFINFGPGQSYDIFPLPLIETVNMGGGDQQPMEEPLPEEEPQLDSEGNPITPDSHEEVEEREESSKSNKNKSNSSKKTKTKRYLQRKA